jgi:hypothetical protein
LVGISVLFVAIYFASNTGNPRKADTPAHLSSVQREAIKPWTWTIRDSATAKEWVELFRGPKDVFTETTWYCDPRIATGRGSRTCVYVRFGMKGTAPLPLRWGINFASDDFLFVNSVIIRTDTTNETVYFEYSRVQREHADGRVWEWTDEATDILRWPLILRVARAGTAAIRFNGRQYYHDYTLTKTDISAIQRTLDIYTLLGGKQVP